jgi:dihydroorotase
MTAPHLLIRHARILLPSGEFLMGDVEIDHQTIVQVAPSIAAPSQDYREIDAQGLTLLPGVIDPQVHFREPGLEYKEDLFTASCACAKGGVTSFLESRNAEYKAADHNPSRIRRQATTGGF